MSDVLDEYLKFTKDTEPPTNFHRWAFISGVAAKLERNVWFQHGPATIHPNMYVMLVGVPGTRKSTAINRVSTLLRLSGFNHFAYNKSSKQKFLEDWSCGFDCQDAAGTFDINKALDTALGNMSSPAKAFVQPAYVCADEFIDFIGTGNFDFISLLTKLWDSHDFYDERFKNSKSSKVTNPTLSILGGITQTNMQLSLPAEVIGHGFLSRFILVYGEQSSRKITWPRVPKPEESEMLAASLNRIASLYGELNFTPAAMDMVDDIYQNWDPLDDVRLQYYCGRRLTHLIKLLIVLAALDETLIATTDHVVEANTILSYTELGMEKALGEFGKSHHSAAMSKILAALEMHGRPLALEELFPIVASDLNRFSDMHTIMTNLMQSGKIQCVNKLFIPKKRELKPDALHVNFDKYIKEIAKLGRL